MLSLINELLFMYHKTVSRIKYVSACIMCVVGFRGCGVKVIRAGLLLKMCAFGVDNISE